MKTGVFKAGKTYKSWIRSSNASGRIQTDKKKDFRGFAIKLMGIDGERFDAKEKHTQDFLLMSHPTMPLGTVKLFRDAVYYSIKWNPIVMLLKFIVSGNMDILKIMKGASKNDSSPLDINYWSTTPYQFGQHQVKYKIVPTSATKSTVPTELTDDYLTKNLQSHLNNSTATFDFYVQLFKNEALTPIEDAGVEWKEENSPFIKLAEIKIPKQQVATNKRFELAEQLSFSPANATTEHAPIGGINRARIIIYGALAKFRHERDNRTMLEPKLDDYNNH